MPFKQRWGLKGLSISSKLVQAGLSAVLGMDRIKVKRNSDPARDLSERISIAAENLGAYDFVHVHSMAPDEAAHTKDPLAKKRVIEALDHALGESLPKLLNHPDLLLIITSDHSTPSSGPLIHSGETVPITMSGPGVRVDRVARFNEIDCASGALGLVRGKEFMLPGRESPGPLQAVANHERAVRAGILARRIRAIPVGSRQIVLVGVVFRKFVGFSAYCKPPFDCIQATPRLAIKLTAAEASSLSLAVAGPPLYRFRPRSLCPKAFQ